MLVGEKIKEIRKQKGLTIRNVAAFAKISTSTLCEIENGKRSGTIDTLEKIAHALGVESKNFFDNDTIRNQNINEFPPSPFNMCEENINNKNMPTHTTITANLLEKIINSNIIEDPDNIPDYVLEAIIASLKMELKNRNSK